MKRLILIPALVASLTLTAVALAGPITKQNGSSALFRDFTSICAVPGYVSYGLCNGRTSTFSNVTGRINAVQPKTGVWNLGLTFTGLQPGASYRLWGNRQAVALTGDVSNFFIVGTVTAATDGTARFSYQTGDPSYLGFDLNILNADQTYHGFTIVTSYWSDERIQVLDARGALYVP
jgi:hypothetical protein